MGFFGRDKTKRRLTGHATVVEAWHRNRDGADGNCKMKLELDVPGIEPLVVSHHEHWMTYNRWPEEGMRVAVTVDADHPDRVDVDWDSVFGRMPGGLLGHGAEKLASLGGVDLDLSLGPERDAPRSEPAADIPARIAELNAQYAAGQITYEEMAAEIQRALGA